MKLTLRQLYKIISEAEQKLNPGNEKIKGTVDMLSGFLGTMSETDEDKDLDEKDEHPVETMDTAVMGKGMLYKGKRMKTPSGLSYGLDYTGAGVDEGKKMKVTKRQLRKLIREEANLLNEDVATSDMIAKKAGELGALLGGYPHVANSVAQAFRDQKRPEAADALMAAYNKSQNWLDMMYVD